MKKDAKIMQFKDWFDKYRLQLKRYNAERLYIELNKPVKKTRKRKKKIS